MADPIHTSDLAQRRARLSPEQRRVLEGRLRGKQVAAGNADAIARQPRPGRIPLSYAQRSLWLTWKLDPASPAYNMPGALNLRGTLDERALAAALLALSERHDILRTLYVEGADGEPEQRVLPAVPMQLTQIEVSRTDGALEQQLHTFAAAPFQLDVEPPFRAALYRLVPTEHVLAFTLHHIAADAWSLGILLDEFLVAYDALCRGVAIPWKPLPIQFADYALWQRQRFDAAACQAEIEHWRARLDAGAAPLELPFDRPRTARQDSSEGRCVLRLPKELSEQLRALQRTQQVSLFVVMLGLLDVVLYRFSGQHDLQIGTPLANRRQAETQGLIGYLLNVQVLRTQLDATRGFSDLLRRVRDVVLDAQAHHQVPFDMLVDALQPERRPGVHPLFQVKCTLIEALVAARTAAGLSIDVHQMSSGHAHFDLSCDFIDAADGIRCVFAYARALFDAPTVMRLARSLQSLAEQVTADCQRPLATLTLPDADDESCGPQTAPAPDVLVQLWRNSANSPECLALRHEELSLNYGAFAARVQRLAVELLARGVGPEVRVGVLAERGCEFVLGVFAVLQANGAYVPLDLQLPAERLAYQLTDSGTKLLLATRPVSWQTHIPVLPLTFEAGEAPPSSAQWVPVPHPNQTAYVIYTSGSTGQPKGVPVSRGALANYVQAVLARLDLPACVESMAMVSTVAADLGHTTFFGALCSGRALHLISTERAFDPDRFASYMAQQRIDVLKIVPSHLQALLQAAQAADVLPRHTLVLGGEATHWSLLERVRTLQPACRVLNHYGPTETTVGVLTQDAALADRQAATLPLGQPLANLRALVLDTELNPVPRGVAGELYLSGAGVAHGYQGRPAQTAERFVAHPQRSGERMYRTGDRVCRRADGTLEFLGRADQQVKIRGYRVELGEVRAVLLAQDAVSEAVVITRPGDDGRLQLHAYIVASTAGEFDAHALRQRLAALLPDYMLPATLTPLPALPLTANGKLDHRALPAPVAALPDEASHVAPQGPTETLLAGVWAQVLRVPRVGRHDNFFELGGDSILTLQVVARARKQGLQLVPKQLMELQTIARIAAAAPAQAAAPSAAAAAAIAPALTPIQRWFFTQPLPARHHWNQSVLLAVDALDAARLRQALQQLVMVHPALRLRFLETAGQWSAELGNADSSWQCSEVDLRAATDVIAAIDAAAQPAQRALHLAGPLLNVVWMRLPAGQRDRLLLIAHHLVVDVVSWRVLIESLQSLYDGTATPDADHYLQWTQRLQDYAQSERCRSQLAYWQAMEQGDADWPASVRGANTVGSTRCVQFALSAEQTAQLLRQCSRAYRTRIEELLLSALTSCLCTWSGRDAVRIELEGHGREDFFDAVDLSRTVGWFTSLYPLRLAPGNDWRESILAVKEQLRAVPDGGVGYGALRYLGTGHGLSGEQPRLTFNYLGQIGAAAEGTWSLADGPHGQERAADGVRRAWFEVIAKVQDERLCVDWYYSENLHDADSIEALASSYAASLGDVIAHCLQEDAGALSPSDMPLARLTQAQIDALRLDAAGIEHVYPLAPMQQGLLLHTLLNAGAGMYLMQDHYRFNAALDVSAFQRAWDRVVQRHEALRTAFVWHGETTQLQVVHRHVPTIVEFSDWRALGEAEALRRLELQLQAEITNGFDLTRPPLMRLRLVQLAEHDFYLVQSFHHVLMDAWCRSLLLSDFFAHYEALREGREALRAVPRPYRDFIGWLQRQDREAARRYWHEQLQGVEGATPLPWRKQFAVAPTLASVIDAVELLSVEQTTALQRLAQTRQLTLNTIVQGAWALLLSRLCGTSDVLFGVTVAGRPLELEGIEETVGLFINTIPLRTRLPAPQTSIVSWLQALLEQNLTMRQYEHLPLVEIQSLSSVPRGRNLFDSLFVFENAPLDESVQGQAQALGIRTLSNRTHTNYPLTVVVIPGRELWLQLSCDSRVFEAADVNRLLAYFKQLMVQLSVLSSSQPEASLGQLGGIAPAEYAELQRACSGPEVAYPFQRGYVGLFEAQVLMHGKRVAARCRGESLTYAGLNSAANRIAHALRDAGVGRDDVVALWSERGLSLLSLVLGTLKAGAAYLGIEGSLPVQRIATMLNVSRCRVVIASAAQADSIRAVLATMPAPPRLLIDADALQLPDRDPRITTHPDQAAYVIYTSGSTGEPKGVVVTQRGMLNNQLSKIPYLRLSARDVIAQTAAQSFDISVWQLLAGLLCGARIEIVPDDIARDPLALLEHVRTTGITVLQSVPALIQGVLDSPPRELPMLRWMLPTGEACASELARRWFERYPAVPLVNAYGPAECADDVSLHACSVPEQSSHYLPIGRPTDNTHLYVLDADLELLPVGVSGELYVAGAGVGRGYLHRPDFSAERFVANPFHPGQRLYRTGDIARYRSDGVLEYLGRADQQVKVRGFRIELGEIEAQIARLEEVQAAAVRVHADALGTPQLVGYVVPRDAAVTAAAAAWRDQLRAHLRQWLPEYMVPSLWVALERLPLTPNGKLDRKALPAPDASEVQSSHEPPQGAVEETIAAVWAEVLGVVRVGRSDNFFTLGGHSLLAMQVIARLRTRLQVEVPLNILFEAATVQEFAVRLGALGSPANDAQLRELDAFLDALGEA